MRAYILCEYSGRVRDAMIRNGVDATSCDILPTESPGPHIQGDCRELDFSGVDMVIAFPPCTHLCSSGAAWFKDKVQQQSDAVEFVRWILSLSVTRIAIENPIGVLSTKLRPPDQIIQPWQFGHPETKATCLWLKMLPPLMPTCIRKPQYLIAGGKRYSPTHYMGPSPERGKLRSLTYHGIADAMGYQWSEFI